MVQRLNKVQTKSLHCFKCPSQSDINCFSSDKEFFSVWGVPYPRAMATDRLSETAASRVSEVRVNRPKDRVPTRTSRAGISSPRLSFEEALTSCRLFIAQQGNQRRITLLTPTSKAFWIHVGLTCLKNQVSYADILVYCYCPPLHERCALATHTGS
jgi:hypothetical protein